jgi:hypothetical protein
MKYHAPELDCIREGIIDADGGRVGRVNVRRDGEYEHEDRDGEDAAIWRGHTSPSYTVVADVLAGNGEKEGIVQAIDKAPPLLQCGAECRKLH